ncbi:MAG: ATP-binding protein, partial [Oscillospiraceae bacterium]|nr:ATP-binding protein [Oscillospiraceae bacterium]
RAPVSARALFKELASSLPDFGEGINLSFKSADISVPADRVLLDDLLRNLILNSAAACGARGNIRVTCSPQNKSARFCVSDDGCGLTPEELERVCEPFYMTDSSRSKRGGGLGLALCDRIAKLHDAALEFVSEKGEGTSVSFSLPLYKEEI